MLVLNLFVCEYLTKFIRGRRRVFSKAPNWKPLFLLKIKIKQNSDCSNKEHNAIFKHIHQSIRAYFRSKKKSGLINGWENIFAYWKEFVQNEALANKLGLFQIQLGGLEVQRIGKKYVLHWEFCIYHRIFDLEKVWSFDVLLKQKNCEMKAHFK